ncbi:Uncharacterized protein HZ326_31707 [Fusarium oxysporum f. sp. albedinis]|nr:Uncharacterized protein HZ326_31707 [Fusarium oxysporum f. sp. albedinis]
MLSRRNRPLPLTALHFLGGSEKNNSRHTLVSLEWPLISSRYRPCLPSQSVSSPGQDAQFHGTGANWVVVQSKEANA